MSRNRSTVRIDSRDLIENRAEGYTTMINAATTTRTSFLVKFRDRYSIHLTWTGVTGGSGKVTVNGGNDANDPNPKPLKLSNGSDMTLDIADGNGSDYIRDYVGITDKYMILTFTGFTAGTIDIDINFAK